ncbi:plexin domain containing lethal (1) G0289 [Choristoneura fumiferana]|uniref:plexin domain containing lethal (1) G0289 n=1 Tax=Choristoneura fumiferana TaxID=7141 RepID=UPI003D156664
MAKMDIFGMRVSVFAFLATCLLTLHTTQEVRAWDLTYSESFVPIQDFIPLEHSHNRHRRDVATSPADPIAASSLPPASVPNDDPKTAKPTAAAAVTVTAAAAATTPANATSDDSNRTTNLTSVPASVTQIPLLGVNGSGIYKGNSSETMPKVSDPILPDDNITTAVFDDQLQMIEAQKNMTNLQYDQHIFYNSTFIGNETYFKEHWENITKTKADVHAILSNSHRRATTLRLSFNFPFYGHPLHNITVATGGFLYTGEHVHNWLAATQYIAPLMANFDTTLTNDSCVKLFDDGEKFTALWENVNLREDKAKNFTFAVTLYKNGDIVFAYKDIPVPVQLINDNDHPVKVGLSDAYRTDKMVFLMRRKTIYEYHRVSFKTHNITSNTVLRMVALPTCLQYDTCESCANHETEFNCSWCEQVRKCSSGTDRNKQDWMARSCEKLQIVNATQCPASKASNVTGDQYFTDHETGTGDHVVTIPEHVPSGLAVRAPAAPPAPAPSPIGAAVSAFAVIALVAALAAWLVYAFKNPHTRSGQMLIKYRPSQWSWRRGEARYTAATIHM